MFYSLVRAELQKRMDAADARYGGFASTHEAIGVALEEWNELQAALHSNQIESVRNECIDLAAVLLRLAEQTYTNEGLQRRSVK